MSKRAERRRRTQAKHKTRIKMWHRLDYGKRVGTASHQLDLDEFVEEAHWIRLVKNTATLCSCQGCRNPRRSYWKYRTRQELKAAIRGREQINEHLSA